MNRRGYLGAIASFGTAMLAGCSVPGQSHTLSNPTTERGTDGETRLFYQAEPSRIATVSILPGKERYSGPTGDQLSIDIKIEHTDGTNITGVMLKLRTLPAGGNPPADAALLPPFGTPHPAIDLYDDPDDGGTILSIPTAEAIGTGTVTLGFILSSIDPSTTEMAVEATIELTEMSVMGTDYVLSALTIIPLPNPTAQ